ncbi:hypothetical protein BDQ17DRAFT_1438069 [Cyathus striatus]|nr:hypothetical protein BDQ17DRAFT_1438069 [Cyathus striatus]
MISKFLVALLAASCLLVFSAQPTIQHHDPGISEKERLPAADAELQPDEAERRDTVVNTSEEDLHTVDAQPQTDEASDILFDRPFMSVYFFSAFLFLQQPNTLVSRCVTIHPSIESVLAREAQFQIDKARMAAKCDSTAT